MENPDPGLVHPQSFRLIEGLQMNTGDSFNSEQVQRDDSEPNTQPEPNQGTLEPRNSPPPQAFIEFRIQQLHNRRFLLLKMQKLRKTAEDNGGGNTEEMTSEDSDELCELEAIQQELEELLVKKEELEKKGQQDMCPTFYKTETPCGGIYTLPPLQLPQEDSTPEQRVKTGPEAETPTGPDVPRQVDSLGQTPGITRCPSCGEVVMTETSSRVGETVCIVCWLCSMIGCVAGCCLLPFCMGHLRNVNHRCPLCQAHIYTFKPF